MFEPGTQSEAALKRWKRMAKRDRRRAAAFLREWESFTIGLTEKESNSFRETAVLIETMIDVE